MKTISKKQGIEILGDIINHINESIDDINQETKVKDSIYHIDNLREEIKEQGDNFNYSLEQFNLILNELFN